MLKEETRKKIKKITIFTKRLMKSSLSGDYLSAFKGAGLEFDQIREYVPGDDIRFIDWNSSAKMNKLMVKKFVEERDRTIILAIDVSASTRFSSESELKSETINQISAVLSFISINNKDKVGALFFSDRIEKWIPPSKNKTTYSAILKNLLDLEPKSKSTKIEEAIKFLIMLKKQNAIVFLISDWIDELENYSKLLKVASLKYDFIAMRILDKCEKELPKFGLLETQDSETGENVIIDTRQKLNIFLRERLIQQKKTFEKYKIDCLDLNSGEPFINPMIEFFHKRIRRQI